MSTISPFTIVIAIILSTVLTILQCNTVSILELNRNLELIDATVTDIQINKPPKYKSAGKAILTISLNNKNYLVEVPATDIYAPSQEGSYEEVDTIQVLYNKRTDTTQSIEQARIPIDIVSVTILFIILFLIYIILSNELNRYTNQPFTNRQY